MSNVLVIRKQDPNPMGNVNMAVNSQGLIPQINLAGGQNIPVGAYFGARHDPNLGYTQRPEFAGVKPEGIVEGGDTNFYYNNQSYGAGNQGKQAAQAQYGLDRDAHEAQPEWNLTTGQRVAGLAAGALPAAWSAMSALSDDSQGDVFSTLGRAGMGALATRSAASPLERWAVDAAGKRQNNSTPNPPQYTASNPTMTPQTSVQTTLNPNLATTTANPPTLYGGSTQQVSAQPSTVIADPTNRALSTKERVNAQVEEANRIQAEPSMLSSDEGDASESDATRNAIENASKVTEATRRKIADEATGQDTQQIGLDGKPVKKARAWSYY